VLARAATLMSNPPATRSDKSKDRCHIARERTLQVIELFAKFVQRQSLNRIISTARQIANQSRDDVWARVCELVFQMDLAEARGYVRARAAKIIRREVGVGAASISGIDANGRDLVARMATERVVQLVMAQVVSDRPPIRRAA
jgi:hypothetical protein